MECVEKNCPLTKDTRSGIPLQNSTQTVLKDILSQILLKKSKILVLDYNKLLIVTVEY